MPRYTSKSIGLVVSFVGTLVLFGWMNDIEILKNLIPTAATMKVTTSIMFILSGLLLLALATDEDNPLRLLLPLLSMGILIFSVTIFFSAILGINTGIESLIVKESSNAIDTTVPGRPSIGTLIGFIVMAFLGFYTKGCNNPVLKILGLFLMLLGSMALVGYAASVPLLYYSSESISTAMAIHTAALFVFLGIGVYGLCNNKASGDIRKPV